MKAPFLTILALLVLVFVSSCQDDDDNMIAIDVPDTYAFLRDGSSTVSFSGQTTRIGMATELIDAMKDNSASVAELDNMFTNPEGVDPFADASLNESTKSVRSKVAASRDLYSTNATISAAIRADFDGWIAAQVNDVFPRWNELAAAGEAGQIADGSSTRYINSWGLEYNQAVNKGLIGALMYDQLANNYLSPAVLDEGTNRDDNDAGVVATDKNYTTMEHKWDEAYGYLFGGSSNPASGLDDLGSGDNFLNKYLGRVEGDADYAGIAATVEQAFRTGRAAIVAGDYAERDRQAAIIKEKLTDVIAIRAVYYLKQGEANLRATPIAYGSAFHDLSEGYGFIYSLRFVADNGNERGNLVAGYIERLRNASGNGWWDISPDELASLADDIAAEFGIDVALAGS